MTAKIKYTVKHHPKLIKKIGYVLLLFAALLFLVCNVVWTPLRQMPIEMQTLAIFYILPEFFFDLNNVAFLAFAMGVLFWLFRWRTGKIELTDEQLIIIGSYGVSIWLRNMWEVDIRDIKYHRWIIRVDSKTDAVQIRFKTEEEFEKFSERFVQLVGHVENIKLKTTF